MQKNTLTKILLLPWFFMLGGMQAAEDQVSKEVEKTYEALGSKRSTLSFGDLGRLAKNENVMEGILKKNK